VTSRLHAVCIDAADPAALASFWAGVLGWAEDPDEVLVLPPAENTGFRLRYLPSDGPKVGPNRLHFDLTSSSLEDQEATVARALDLGARHIDVGQLPEEDHVVLADPEGNEFCVIGPDNAFLAGCGLIGAVSCDGSQEVGYFWSRALDWPLVWDQNEETAIQAPFGGTKITWGGPPLTPKRGKNRLHFDVLPPPDGEVPAEVERLLSLGASRLDGESPYGPDHGGPVAMIDPDGNEFCVLTG
jgi:catechol 2,3-dioxygenase-like lactoylglutathione lyase family enzyme